MSDRIFIAGLSLHAYHGVMPYEGKVGQTFTIDMVLDIDLSAAARSDKVADTVSYDKVVECATAAFGKRKVRDLQVSDVKRMLDSVKARSEQITGKGTPKMFYGIDEDAQAFAAFIRDWVTENDRWGSPKFLFGESYGTLRAAIMVTNFYAGPHAITMPSGTFTLTRPGYDDGALVGDLDIAHDLVFAFLIGVFVDQSDRRAEFDRGAGEP